LERVRAVVIEELSAAAKTDLAILPDTANVRTDIPVDSLALLQVFLRIEERLEVEIDETALSEVGTLGELVACVAASGARSEE
jgi:acyl carrier protein